MVQAFTQSLVFSRYPETEEELHPGVARLSVELIERNFFHLKMQGFLKRCSGQSIASHSTPYFL